MAGEGAEGATRDDRGTDGAQSRPFGTADPFADMRGSSSEVSGDTCCGLQHISLHQLRLYWHIWSTGISWPLEPLLSCLLKRTHFALFTWAGSVDGCRNSGNLLCNLLCMYFCLAPDRLHFVGGDHYLFFWGGCFNCMWECIPNLAVLSA